MHVFAWQKTRRVACDCFCFHCISVAENYDAQLLQLNEIFELSEFNFGCRCLYRRLTSPTVHAGVNRREANRFVHRPNLMKWIVSVNAIFFRSAFRFCFHIIFGDSAHFTNIAPCYESIRLIWFHFTVHTEVIHTYYTTWLYFWLNNWINNSQIVWINKNNSPWIWAFTIY